MLKRHRSSESGQFVSPETAALKPAETVAESVKKVDLEAVAQKLFEFQTGGSWNELSQETRDSWRALASVAHEEIKGG